MTRDIERVEGRGSLNFLELDDVPLAAEGEPIDPDSIVDGKVIDTETGEFVEAVAVEAVPPKFIVEV